MTSTPCRRGRRGVRTCAEPRARSDVALADCELLRVLSRELSKGQVPEERDLPVVDERRHIGSEVRRLVCIECPEAPGHDAVNKPCPLAHERTSTEARGRHDGMVI